MSCAGPKIRQTLAQMADAGALASPGEAGSAVSQPAMSRARTGAALGPSARPAHQVRAAARTSSCTLVTAINASRAELHGQSGTRPMRVTASSRASGSAASSSAAIRLSSNPPLAMRARASSSANFATASNGEASSFPSACPGRPRRNSALPRRMRRPNSATGSVLASQASRRAYSGLASHRAANASPRSAESTSAVANHIRLPGRKLMLAE